MEKAMEEENGKKKEINDMYSSYSDHTCGDGCQIIPQKRYT